MRLRQGHFHQRPCQLFIPRAVDEQPSAPQRDPDPRRIPEAGFDQSAGQRLQPVHTANRDVHGDIRQMSRIDMVQDASETLHRLRVEADGSEGLWTSSQAVQK